MPPDEVEVTEDHSQVSEKTGKVHEGPIKVLKTCATYTTVSLNKVINATVYQNVWF